MWLESELGLGSSFFFELPLSRSGQWSAESWRAIRTDWVWRERAFRTDRTAPARPPARPRFVVCDESGELGHEFARYSQETDYVAATTLEQTRRALTDLPAHALVVNAPTWDELWTVVEELKPDAVQTPIIGCAISPRLARALKAGAIGYVVKPVLPDDLDRVLRGIGHPVHRVLLVDDDPDVLSLFTRMLLNKDSDLEILTAGTGERGLAMMRDVPPDLIMLDIMMPDMDGWQFLDMKRAAGRFEEIPVVIVSAQDPSEQPLTSPALIVTTGAGVSLSQVLNCALQLPDLMTQFAPVPGPTPQ